MEASSSTIKTCLAMGYLYTLRRLGVGKPLARWLERARGGVIGSEGAPAAGRKLDHEASPLAWRRMHADKAIVIVDDSLGDGQAEARALALGREVGLKDALTHLFGHAGAGIGDLDHGHLELFVVMRGQAHRTRLLAIERRDRVVEKIDQHALDLIAIEFEGREARLEIHPELDTRVSRLKQRHHLG